MIYKNELLNIILNFNEVKKRFRLCVRKQTTENIPKIPYLDLEFYMRIMLSDEESITVTYQDLKLWRIPEEKLFKIAAENTLELQMQFQAVFNHRMLDMIGITNMDIRYGASHIGDMRIF